MPRSIQFADYMVRLLTGGAVFGVSLAYDALCGAVPPVDSPLLGFLSMMKLTWCVSLGTRLQGFRGRQQYLEPGSLRT